MVTNNNTKANEEVPSDSLPNFLIIGAQKSGTTTLAEVLDQHPDVHISEPKEPHFLAYGDREGLEPYPDAISNTAPPARTLAEYAECFAKARGVKALGEASPSTMPLDRALERTVEFLGKPKIIAILRQPAERAYSNYMHVVARHGESCKSFEEAIEAEQERIADGWGPLWHYVDKGFYFRRLSLWAEAVGQNNLKVVLFEKLKTNPRQLFREVFEFLEVDPDFEIGDPHQANPTRIPKNQLAEKLIHTFRPIVRKPLSLLPKSVSNSLKRAVTSKPDKMDPKIKARLTENYRDDIHQLEKLTGHDLSTWLSS